MVPLPSLPQPNFWISCGNQQGQQPCPGESKLLFGLTGMTPKISYCSWPMPRNSKKPSGISTRFVPSCSIQYHWRDLSAHQTIEPFNLQRAAFKIYTSELKHWPMFWSKPWFRNNCNSCTCGHNMAQYPTVHSSLGAILARPITKMSRAIHLTDQLTRKREPRLATTNLMMESHDIIFAWESPLMTSKEAPRQGTCCWLLTYELCDIQNTSWVAAISRW